MAILLMTASAQAVTTRFSAFDLWPTPGEKNFFFISSSEGLEKYQFSADLMNSYLLRPIEVVNASGVRVRSAVDYAFVHYLSGAFALTDFWQIGVSAALISRAKVADPTVTPAPTPSNVTKFGDVRVSSRLRVLDADRYRFGLAIEPFVIIPSGAENQYLGDAGLVGGGRVIADYLIMKKLRATVNAGAEARERVTVSNIDFNDRVSFGGGLSADIGKGLSAAAEGVVTTPIQHFFKDKNVTPVEFAGGLQWDIFDTGFSVGAGGGTCAVCGIKGAKARAFLNLGYRFQNPAIRERHEAALVLRDKTFQKSSQPSFKEVVLDLDKNCPADPKDFDPEQHDLSCPKYFRLKDSIVSLSDKGRQERFSDVVLALRQKNCPAQPQDFDPEKHDPSCPKLLALRESLVTLKANESDESFSQVVLRLEKNCPKNPKDFNPEKHDTTCPKYFELRHLIAQVRAEDKEKNKKDLTIQSPEPEGVSVSDDISTPVRFAFNNIKLDAAAGQVLDGACRYLKKHSSITALEIEGHADAVGEKTINQWISLQRAKTVAGWMKSQCSASLTLSAKGKGSNLPAATNATAEGRAQNRRVQIRVVR